MKGRYLCGSGYSPSGLGRGFGAGLLVMLLLFVLENTGCGGRGADQRQGGVQGADTGKEQGKITGHGPVDTLVENVPLGVYSNGTLARKEIVLPDGTRVTMRPGTILRLGEKFKKGDRELWLDGDALFEVSADKGGGAGNGGGTGNDGGAGAGKPMIIHTSFLKIEVLAPASRFRVDAKKKEAGEEADLLSGRLKVTKSYHSDTDNEPDTIVAGEMVMINRDIDLMEKEKMDGTEMKSWDADK